MYETTARLQKYLDLYKVKTLTHGAKEDKMGDAFEDYCVDILNDNLLLENAKKNGFKGNNTDEYIFNSIFCKKIMPPIDSIKKISATKNIQHRVTGGNPKTDVIVDCKTNSNVIQIPISVKQTTASKVAMAEFDVDTIVKEIGINDTILIPLLEKHQLDASAKNFTKDEKKLLRERMIPYVHSFVRWVVSGTSISTDDLRYPKLLLKFTLSKTDNIKDISCVTVDDYVDHLIYDKNGLPKKGGFGTGLGWTYATGSKGKKIQFKG